MNATAKSRLIYILTAEFQIAKDERQQSHVTINEMSLHVTM